MLRTKDFDFDLPSELIAQRPLAKRADARMMVLYPGEQRIEHRGVHELPSYLDSGDLLVVNNTRVIPARLFGQREDTGGRVEILLVEPIDDSDAWEAMYRAAGRPRIGLRIAFAKGELVGEIVGVRSGGRIEISFTSHRPLRDILQDYGMPPLPPYIPRPVDENSERCDDLIRYQTVYAECEGAIAAPTAGLHFSDALFASCDEAGIGRTAVTLHVGPGTFKPVKADKVSDHIMESERYILPDEAALAINSVDRTHNRVVAVGSTSVRTMETVAAQYGSVVPAKGRSDLFIYPPYDFRVVNAMLTNFHLPKSTLIMMVCALGGTDFVMRAYREAIAEGYRFYSYGDCMLIL